MPSNSPDDELERRLFDEALDQPAGAAREAWLAGACRGDEPLRQRLLALLRVEDQESGFLPESQPTAILPPVEQPGELIGRYKLLQQIGEGGFGTVWMAEQTEPVTRRVALKIIRLGMDTREVCARFEAERQALAMMDHPHIAKVLDAGATDKGRPFFVMELVKGVPITRFCDEQQLGMKERLALFGDVCSAINHAHQKGIIHRDIKPSNVMVTLHGDKAVVKVIDFGIAKATQGKLTDKTLFTRFEQFIGTPVYMSPEQAALSGLDIDTRSDIYGLGILLYELLTGKPPFDAKTLASAGYEEMRRIIREVEPPKPSSRLSTVAGDERTAIARARHVAPDSLHRLVEPDLDWIVMKAIEKDRSRRYETANGLALDIQRFLADEPVSATPPSTAYKFRKFARRNRKALRMAAGIAVILLITTAVSVWQALRATSAEALATQRLDDVAAERDAKDRARTEAEGIAEFLHRILRSPDPDMDGRLVTVAELLDDAAAELDSGPAIQPAQRATLLNTLGQTYGGLGIDSRSVPLFEKVRDYWLRTAGPEDPATLSATGNLALGLARTGRLREAMTLQENVLETSRRRLGPEHPDTLVALNRLGLTYAESGRCREALQMQESCLEMMRKVLGPEQRDTVSAMNDLANSLEDAGRQDEALKTRKEVHTILMKSRGKEHPDTLAVMSNLALSLSAAGRTAEALQMREEVLAISQKLLGPKHRDTLRAKHNLAISLSESGQMDEALKAREEVLEAFRAMLGPDHASTLAAMTSLAGSLDDSGRAQEAFHLREEVLATSRRAFGEAHPQSLTAMQNLALSLMASGRTEEAVRFNEEVLNARRTELGPKHPDTLSVMHNLALALFRGGRFDEALKLEEQVVASRSEVLGPEHPQTLGAKLTLGTFLSESGRQTEAIPLEQEVLAIRTRELGPEHPDTLKALNNLALSYAETGRAEEARTMRVQVLDLSRKLFGPEHPRTLTAMQNMSLSHFDDGNFEKAREMDAEVLLGRKKVLGPEHPETLRAMHNLATSSAGCGRDDEALRLREELVELSRKVNGPSHPDTRKAEADLALSHAAAGRVPAAASPEAGDTRPRATSPPAPSSSQTPVDRDKDEIRLLEETLAKSRGAGNPKDPATIVTMIKLAEAHGKAGNGRKSIKLGEDALALARSAFPPGDPRTLQAMSVLARNYRSVEMNDAAAKLEAEGAAAAKSFSESP